MTSGVVLSGGDQRFVLLAEGEANELAPAISGAEKARAGYRCHAHIAREPLRELDVSEIAELREIREHVVGAFRNGEGESALA